MTQQLSSQSSVAVADAGQHYAVMSKTDDHDVIDLGQRIAQARSRAGLNQTELGRRVGTTRSAVSQWEGGRTEPTPEKLRNIAMLTGVSFDWLATARGEPFSDNDDDRESRGVPVKGYVGAGAQAHFLPLHDGELDRVDPPSGATSKTVAFEIRGESLGELFDRWLVFFDDVRRPVTSDLIGKLCVVGLVDGRVLVKKVRRAGEGRFTLISDSMREAPIENVEIEWAARVKTMVPR